SPLYTILADLRSFLESENKKFIFLTSTKNRDIELKEQLVNYSYFNSVELVYVCKYSKVLITKLIFIKQGVSNGTLYYIVPFDTPY
ncbi:hypothetical protein, partial [Hungatella effluvii]|uniref:hypothetical protein n=1 Tax=Hungatella effluvii TaxID=1096246 RepID=UPI002A807FAF